MNWSDFKYYEKNLPENYIDRKKFLEDLKIKWRKELMNDEHLKKYTENFQSHSPIDFESFVFQIVEQKCHLVNCQNLFISRKDYTPDIRYRKEAERAIEWIQQKKLFNIQCLWRSNQFEHPLLRCTYDFHFWENHIHDCPFLEPVSEQEIKTMQMYLRSPNSEPLQFHHFLLSFQDYEELLETEGDEEHYINMPDWYEFYDGYRGTGSLLKLPDLRGQQEVSLRAVLLAENKRKEKENPPPIQNTNIDTRPFFWVHDEVTNYFKLFEVDNFFKELHTLSKEESKKFQEEEDSELDEALEILKEVKEPVYIVGGKEWKEAIKETALRYINKMVADDLDVLYEVDALFEELDIDTVKEDLTKEALEHSNHMVKWLKEAAIIAGEEPNKYW